MDINLKTVLVMGNAVRAATRSCEFNSDLVHFILKSKFQKCISNAYPFHILLPIREILKGKHVDIVGRTFDYGARSTRSNPIRVKIFTSFSPSLGISL